jgi:hypothetical protein
METTSSVQCLKAPQSLAKICVLFGAWMLVAPIPWR